MEASGSRNSMASCGGFSGWGGGMVPEAFLCESMLRTGRDAVFPDSGLSFRLKYLGEEFLQPGM